MYYISIALRGVWLPYRRQLCFHFAISPKHNSSAIRKISYASIPHIWETRQPLRIGRSPEIRSIRVRRFWIMKKEMSEHLKRQWQKVRGEFGATEQTEKLREIPPKKTGIDVRKCKSAQIELRARACKTTFPITKPGTRLLESRIFATATMWSTRLANESAIFQYSTVRSADIRCDAKLKRAHSLSSHDGFTFHHYRFVIA